MYMVLLTKDTPINLILKKFKMGDKKSQYNGHIKRVDYKTLTCFRMAFIYI